MTERLNGWMVEWPNGWTCPVNIHCCWLPFCQDECRPKDAEPKDTQSLSQSQSQSQCQSQCQSHTVTETETETETKTETETRTWTKNLQKDFCWKITWSFVGTVKHYQRVSNVGKCEKLLKSSLGGWEWKWPDIVCQPEVVAINSNSNSNKIRNNNQTSNDWIVTNTLTTVCSTYDMRMTNLKRKRNYNRMSYCLLCWTLQFHNATRTTATFLWGHVNDE